ncbi:RlpA-like double-psi beta-barrel-protein domain-containing protein-containing protein [Hygrophoropsis aurantiaca]|uniref:RlpA-like double-psi beta-barrel-protein domain-containing protein-containing protein n=1 Tax=Hygrophoropsis aurantiaca TaxID=72124 RepID=A0ACB8AFD3_9AGAM|nr:RlpA-like double-psi beta-barrel-protein domain-containing protein-containing protein [Hygrophoropsis aurantiaca]
MSPITKCLVAFTLALSATALTTPHISRNAYTNHHRAVAHQNIAVAADIAVPASDADAAPKKRRRSLNKRCAPKSSSSITSSSAATSSAPVNAAPPPSVSSSVASSSSSTVQWSSSAPAASSSSQNPPPSTSSAPPSTTWQAAPSTTSSAPPAQTSSANTSGEPSFMFGTQVGQGTYYGTGLGACGITNVDTDYIAAVSWMLFDTYPGYTSGNPNDNPVCNQKVQASYQGKSVTVTITDRCTGCAITDLDFSPSAFSQLADQSVGRIYGMDWIWV